MKSISKFIQNFLNRSGGFVFLATILARILSFLASLIALHFLDHKELGVILFAYNIIVFILPFAGFGQQQSLIRFGALSKTQEEKNSLFLYALKKGLLASLAIVTGLIVLSFTITFQFENTKYYLIALSLVILSTYLFEIIQIHFRLKHDNKSFALLGFINSLVLIIGVFMLSFFYQEVGYVAALILTPLISSLFFIKKLNLSFKHTPLPTNIGLDFWKYGIFASMSNVVTQLLFAIDILLIGYLLNDSAMVTNYKYVSLIPFSFLFLPRVFMSTDFVAFTEKISDQKFIKKYIIDYIKLFSLLSIGIVVFSWLFATQILEIFGSEFTVFTETFLILIIGVCGIFILRGLFGNLLSAIGKAHVNFYITSTALCLNIMSNYYLIPELGIKGAAITSAVLMWFTGILSVIWFYRDYQKLLVNKK